jgi:6-phospho-beta-glucosidase
MLFNEYLYYFYYREKAVENILGSERTRGESILFINQSMLGELQGLNPEDDVDFGRMLDIYAKYNHQREISYMAAESSVQRNESAAPKFNLYSPEEGGYAGIALAFIQAKLTGAVSEMVLSVPNRGTADWLRDDDVVETTCIIGPEGAETKKDMRPLPESAKVLIQTMKQYERLAARGILEENDAMITEALMVHPLVNSYSLAKSLTAAYRNAMESDWRMA